MLTRIEFENFRGFRQLRLTGLQRVNLIVGKNNSGKTSLLEGLAVVANSAAATTQFTQLRKLESIVQSQFGHISYSNWVVHDESSDKTAKLAGVWDGETRNVVLAPVANSPDAVAPQQEGLSRSSKGGKPKSSDKLRSCVISSHHKNPQELVKSLGTAIRRRNGEEQIQSTLKDVDPRIQKVRIVPIQNGTQVEVDIGLSRLVPLSQLGQGVYRLVEIFSEIIGADAQMAFIDEIENGIHHSCLVDVWHGIAEAARQFNVQIFATTHSHECIEAAHQAFSVRATYDFAVVQLFRESGQIQGRVLDQKLIAAGIAGDIDLRG